MPRKDVLFLTLKVFSATGGIEKVCRILGKVFWENSLDHGTKLKICSMHDKTNLADNLLSIFKSWRASRSTSQPAQLIHKRKLVQIKRRATGVHKTMRANVRCKQGALFGTRGTRNGELENQRRLFFRLFRLSCNPCGKMLAHRHYEAIVEQRQRLQRRE